MPGVEHHIIGPPGTGKTTYLTKLAGESIEDVGWDGVMLCSFSRAAAAELASRNDEIPDFMIGTLHSFAYRAIGMPPVCETKKYMQEWNKENPHLALSGAADSADVDDEAATFDSAGARGETDKTFSTYQVLRARMTPPELWPQSVRTFAKRWEEWKQSVGAIDFTDMIEMALRESVYAPGAPRIIIGDEAQDWSRSEVALIRKWGQQAQEYYLAGDPNQAIYYFKGASPDALRARDDGDVEYTREVLPQSYRVPRKVQRMATWWIKRAGSYDDAPYRPREDAEGEIRLLPTGGWKQPELIFADMERYLDMGKSVMVLTSCAYMLEPMKAIMHREGVPFGNKYRRKRGDWNPLASGSDKRKTAVDRVLAFLRPDERVWGTEGAREWSVDDVKAWLDVIESKGTLKRGAKSGAFDNDPPAISEVMALFERQEDFEQVYDGNLKWLESHLIESAKKTFSFPLRVAERMGPSLLAAEPPICLGTIHSVKGGQADVVYVCPDLSQAGYLEWGQPGEARDSIYRLFYVAMTRARESLVLCSQSTPLAVNWR